MATSEELFERRKRRNRVRLRAAADRPRLSVFRSNQHIYAQVIDDRAGRTLAQASTIESAFESTAAGDGKPEGKAEGGMAEGAAAAATRGAKRAERVGKLLAERALAAGVTHVVFDRGGYRYHGRVKALADAAREAGLAF